MIEITGEIRALIDRTMTDTQPAEDEYIEPSDGLLHCRRCGEPRQTVVPHPFGQGYFMPRCVCACQREENEKREAAAERQRRMERIRRRKAEGLQDRYLRDYTFANDNGQNHAQMDKIHAYVQHWEDMLFQNIGLLLFGDVGTGKSFAAGCIANALLEQDVPVLMTNFPMIINRLNEMYREDRAAFLHSLDEYDLLILDDLGVERDSEYALEQVYTIVDGRYRCRKPMIVTTNLRMDEIKNPRDRAHARIYDRILERCAPFVFDGKNFRKENAAITRQAARELVSKDTGTNITSENTTDE